MIGLTLLLFLQMAPAPPAPAPVDTWRGAINFCRGDTCQLLMSTELFTSPRECALAVSNAAGQILGRNEDPQVHTQTLCVRQSQAEYDRSLGRTAT